MFWQIGCPPLVIFHHFTKTYVLMLKGVVGDEVISSSLCSPSTVTEDQMSHFPWSPLVRKEEQKGGGEKKKKKKENEE